MLHTFQRTGTKHNYGSEFAFSDIDVKNAMRFRQMTRSKRTAGKTTDEFGKPFALPRAYAARAHEIFTRRAELSASQKDGRFGGRLSVAGALGVLCGFTVAKLISDRA